MAPSQWSMVLALAATGLACSSPQLDDHAWRCASNADCLTGYTCLAGLCQALGPDAGRDAGALDAAADVPADAWAAEDAPADPGAADTADAAPDTPSPDPGADPVSDLPGDLAEAPEGGAGDAPGPPDVAADVQPELGTDATEADPGPDVPGDLGPELVADVAPDLPVDIGPELPFDIGPELPPGDADGPDVAPSPVALALAGPDAVAAGACTCGYVVVAVDEAGLPTEVAAKIAVALTAVGSATLHGDATCTEPLEPLTLAAGAKEVTFCVLVSEAGEVHLTTTSALDDAQLNVTASWFFADADETGPDFAIGYHAGTAWSGNALTLAGADDGQFTSRIFDAGFDDARWTTLAWTPAQPYGLGLPDDGAAEAGYPSGGADMADSVLLLHLDGPGIGPALALDSSGRGHDALVVTGGGGPATWTQGVFGMALTTADDHLSVGTANPDFAFGAGDFTWALWLRVSSGCAGELYMASEGAAGEARVRLGCNKPACGGGPMLQVRPVDGTQVTLCHPAKIDDGAWHHLAAVVDRSVGGTLTLYVDAVPATTQVPWTDDQPLDLSAALLIAAPGDAATAAVDEVAVSRAALAPQQVAARYARAATLDLQLRSCTLPDCSDVAATFVGPDGTADSVFSAAGLGALGPPATDLPQLPTGRYLQYRVTLGGLAGGIAPRLEAVRVEAWSP